MAEKNKPEIFAFTIKYKGTTDRIITEVQVFPAFDPDNPSVPPPSPLKTSALWDTGATNSVITKATATALGLTPVGAKMVSHAGGITQSNTYLVNIMLPNQVGIPGVLVTECVDTVGQRFGVIIGMDIITKGDFVITNVNKITIMSFRFPSIQSIDYVVETNRIKYAGIGRNSACPCGKKDSTGKPVKFKNCCGKVAS